MSSTRDSRRLVAEVLQKGYGDATQTFLDHQVAGQVIDALTAAGWCPPETLAALIASAGGTIDVLTRYLIAPPTVLVREEQPTRLDVAFRLSVTP